MPFDFQRTLVFKKTVPDSAIDMRTNQCKWINVGHFRSKLLIFRPLSENGLISSSPY